MGVTSNLERYRHLAHLGAGGMSSVELAEDTLLGRQVALKRMHRDDIRSNSRLRREALVGASLTHPNLVSIFDIFTTANDDEVIVMEYVEGETLAQRLRREGKPDLPTAMRILTGVASALDAIHAERIVHRDVKPGNILLGHDGSVKLADLGIAAVADRTRLTTDGAVIGTFSYMAPEQLEGAAATPAVDIYALAAVAFEVLSGKRARTEPNPVALAHAISTQSPPDLRTAWPEAPAAAADVLTRGMSRDPGRRPRSAGELVGRLQAALQPKTTAPIFPPPQRPQRRASAVAPVAIPAPMAARPEPPASAGSPRNGVAGARPAASGARVSPQASPRAIRPRPEAAGRSAARIPRRAALAPPSSPSTPTSSRGRVLALAGLGLAAVVAVVVVAASSGGSPRASNTAGAIRPPARHHVKHAGAAGTGTGAAAGSGQPAAPASSGSATAANSSGFAGTPTSTGSAGGSSTATTGAGSPVGAVETFYHLAAAHQYSAAWALADPNFRNQLQGYQSFANGQAADRSITFTGASVTNQSADSATVYVRTTSVRSTGTQHCFGPVNLVRSSSGWSLDHIDINCT
ncbi:MAG TPA: protein kinase [Solirubrobacteraceae bacterium]|nr:protein kinase [Solirubrobacteraceae bacterium]